MVSGNEGNRRSKMSSASETQLDRLTGYQILPTPEGFDAYTLILRTDSVEFAVVAGHQNLLKLAASIQKHVVDPTKER
jgi:hypothetical protein